MKDLPREERIEQHVSKLEKRISEMIKDGRKNKWQRIRLSFYILSPLVYYIALDGDIINGIAGLLGWLIIAPLIAIGIMCICYLVLGYTIDGVLKDAFAIGRMVGRKEAVELSKLNKE
jgi:nucleoside permease NupC